VEPLLQCVMNAGINPIGAMKMKKFFIEVKNWIKSLFKKPVSNKINPKRKNRNLSEIRKSMALDGQYSNLKEMSETVGRVHSLLNKCRKIPRYSAVKKTRGVCDFFRT